MEEQNNQNFENQEPKEEAKETKPDAKKNIPKMAIIIGAVAVVSVVLLAVILGGEKSTNRTDKSNDDNSSSVENDNSTSGQENNGSNDGNESGENDEENSSTNNKIEDTISVGSPFSEGLAFVQYASYPDKTFCIDKSGNVVFKLDDTFRDIAMDYIYFKNGICVTPNNYICDSKGNVTYPEDVGVTNFYNVALDGGYILADIVVSNFESASQKMGVMDFSFNWIVEPTEEIYDAFYEWTITALNNYDDYTYHSDYLYHDDMSLNLKTGEIESNISEPAADFITRQELEKKYSTLGVMSNIVNEKAAITFYNTDTREYYVSVIDNKGTLMYEPIKTTITPYKLRFDGENIVIADKNYGSDIKLEAFNSDGTSKVGFDTSTLLYMISWELQNGVIVINSNSYYNINFEPLF